MLYHPEEHIFSKITKLIAFGASLFVMMWLFSLVFFDDIKIPQEEITLKLNINNQVNICLPDDSYSKEYFFNF